MTTAHVRLSVIIPVYNGAAILARCLDSLGRSTFRDFEYLVVDDASTDDTRAIAQQRGATVLALDQNGGPARARNRGAAAARGELLLFIDADVCVHPETLERVYAHFQGHPATAAVMGSYDDRPSDRGFVSQYKNLLHHYVHQQSRTDAWTFWAGCGAIRRQVFLDLGGFDEDYRRPCIEDIELGFRLRQAGHRIDLEPSIQVTHLKRWTVRNLVRTDFVDRALPWFALMLRYRTMPPDLNVTVAHRASVVLVHALIVGCGLLAAGWLLPLRAWAPAGVAGWWLPLALALVAAALVVLNADLYRFFARKRGLLFAVRALPLHWFYYAYCGVAVGVGLTTHLWHTLRDRRPLSPSLSS